jgi:hypothetical protein
MNVECGLSFHILFVLKYEFYVWVNYIRFQDNCFIVKNDYNSVLVEFIIINSINSTCLLSTDPSCGNFGY